MIQILLSVGKDLSLNLTLSLCDSVLQALQYCIRGFHHLFFLIMFIQCFHYYMYTESQVIHATIGSADCVRFSAIYRVYLMW
jgi:hypothetical protein